VIFKNLKSYTPLNASQNAEATRLKQDQLNKLVELEGDRAAHLAKLQVLPRESFRNPC